MKRSKVFSGLIVVILVLGFFLTSAHAVEVTACLGGGGDDDDDDSRGGFYNIAIDSPLPAAPCASGDPQVTWNTEGSAGPAGPAGGVGPAGPAGLQGDPGTNGLNGAAGAPGTNGTNGTDGADGANGSSAPVFQFVGTSASGFKGDGGIIAFNQACNTDHPGSRMCNSREIIETVGPPALASTSWVHTTDVIRIEREDNPAVSGGGPRYYIRDYSGRRTLQGFESLTCRGWSTGINGFGGLVVLGTGQFTEGNCSSTNRVACCAPVTFD